MTDELFKAWKKMDVAKRKLADLVGTSLEGKTDRARFEHDLTLHHAVVEARIAEDNYKLLLNGGKS